jgi:hypothetical protein
MLYFYLRRQQGSARGTVWSSAQAGPLRFGNATNFVREMAQQARQIQQQGAQRAAGSAAGGAPHPAVLGTARAPSGTMGTAATAGTAAAGRPRAPPPAPSAPRPGIAIGTTDDDTDEDMNPRPYLPAFAQNHSSRAGGASAFAAAAPIGPGDEDEDGEGADLLGGRVDEAANRREFLEALMEWRRGGSGAGAGTSGGAQQPAAAAAARAQEPAGRRPQHGSAIEVQTDAGTSGPATGSTYDPFGATSSTSGKEAMRLCAPYKNIFSMTFSGRG